MKLKNFKLADQNGKYHKLADYKGKWVVLYFYPKDDTPGCTVEACKFRDGLNRLQELNVVILGVSKDSVASHKKFAEKYHLNFPVLSDENMETIGAYNALSEGTIRMTYLINPQGEIQKVYENVNPAVHAEEILKDVRGLAHA